MPDPVDIKRAFLIGALLASEEFRDEYLWQLAGDSVISGVDRTIKSGEPDPKLMKFLQHRTNGGEVLKEIAGQIADLLARNAQIQDLQKKILDLRLTSLPNNPP